MIWHRDCARRAVSVRLWPSIRLWFRVRVPLRVIRPRTVDDVCAIKSRNHHDFTKKNKQSFIKIDNRSSLSSFCYHRLQDVGWFTTWRHRLIISLLHRSLYISILKLKGKTLLHLGLQIWYWINNDFLLLLFPVVFLAFKTTSRCTWILLDIVAADLEIRVVEIS